MGNVENAAIGIVLTETVAIRNLRAGGVLVSHRLRTLALAIVKHLPVVPAISLPSAILVLEKPWNSNDLPSAARRTHVRNVNSDEVAVRIARFDEAVRIVRFDEAVKIVRFDEVGRIVRFDELHQQPAKVNLAGGRCDRLLDPIGLRKVAVNVIFVPGGVTVKIGHYVRIVRRCPLAALLLLLLPLLIANVNKNVSVNSVKKKWMTRDSLR